MSDNAISSGIMSTASIITTIVIIIAGFAVAGSIGASINRSGENLATQINTDFEIITTGDVQVADSNVSIFVKNCGATDISSFSFLDIFMDGEYYNYNSVLTTEYRWTATILNDNGNSIWDIQETIRISLFFPSGETLGVGVHKVSLTIQSQTEEFIFSL